MALALVLIIVVVIIALVVKRMNTSGSKTMEVEEKAEKMMQEDKIIRFNSDRGKKEYDRIKREALVEAFGEAAGEEYLAWEKNLDKWASRNLKGIEYEKIGQIDKAIKLYKRNVEDKADTPGTYKRLAIIFRKRGQFEDEIDVLEKATAIIDSEYFRKRLDKAKALAARKKQKETKPISPCP
jgi:tetratricopeptide (TPR) repeat protein